MRYAPCPHGPSPPLLHAHSRRQGGASSGARRPPRLVRAGTGDGATRRPRGDRRTTRVAAGGCTPGAARPSSPGYVQRALVSQPLGDGWGRCERQVWRARRRTREHGMTRLRLSSHRVILAPQTGVTLIIGLHVGCDTRHMTVITPDRSRQAGERERAAAPRGVEYGEARARLRFGKRDKTSHL